MAGHISVIRHKKIRAVLELKQEKTLADEVLGSHYWE
jgi:hypothetical protein